MRRKRKPTARRRPCLATKRHLRHHVVHEIGGCRAHLPAEARRAEPAALTGERHEARLRARVASESREPAAEKAAIEVSLELLPHEPRECELHGAVGDGAVECLEVVLDDLVERRRLRPAALVGDGLAHGGARVSTPCALDCRESSSALAAAWLWPGQIGPARGASPACVTMPGLRPLGDARRPSRARRSSSKSSSSDGEGRERESERDGASHRASLADDRAGHHSAQLASRARRRPIASSCTFTMKVE